MGALGALMLVKAVIVFLCAMALIAWIGGLVGKLRPRRADRFCGSCGRPRVGRGPCPCGRA